MKTGEEEKTTRQSLEILHIHPYIKALNGSERLMIELIRSWPNEDRHRIVTVGKALELPYGLDSAVKTSLWSPAPNSPMALLWSYVVLPFTSTKGKADIIIAHSHAAIFPAAVRKLFKGGKIVYLCHEPPRFLYDLWSLTLSRRGFLGKLILRIVAPFPRAIDKWAVRHADTSIVLSQYSAKQFSGVYGYAALVEPAGVDFQHFHQTKGPQKKNEIITVSKLHPRKNIKLLLEALQLPELAKFNLVSVGKGPQESELKLYGDKLGVSDRVNWLGSVDDKRLRQAYAATSIFAFCAHDEPFGLVVLEAMSMGIPVVVPNEGGPQEIVGDGKYGSVYKQGDAKSLALAIAKASNQSVSQTTAAQKHAHTYTWSRYANAIAEIVQKL